MVHQIQPCEIFNEIKVCSIKKTEGFSLVSGPTFCFFFNGMHKIVCCRVTFCLRVILENVEKQI